MSGSKKVAKKEESPAAASPGQVAKLFRLGGATAWLLALLVAGFAAGTSYLWFHVREHVLASPEYQLGPDQIRVTAPPPWIRADVKLQALTDGDLVEPQSIMDEGLLARVTNAFEVHPWVGEVVRVSKHYPARIEVVLEYRRPVCMVELPTGGLYPVDAKGVVLPSADFTAEEAHRYPRLSGIRTVPADRVGAAWGDREVAGGAALAEALIEVWNAFGLKSIIPSKNGNGVSAEVEHYELLTHGGTRVLWGFAPGLEMPGDPLSQDKIARLEKLLIVDGVKVVPDADVIDLRRSDKAKSPARAARRGEPKETPR